MLIYKAELLSILVKYFLKRRARDRQLVQELARYLIFMFKSRCLLFSVTSPCTKQYSKWQMSTNECMKFHKTHSNSGPL